nr:MAG TPA: hypothetical protein [Caudoviricetes sp.]
MYGYYQAIHKGVFASYHSSITYAAGGSCWLIRL